MEHLKRLGVGIAIVLGCVLAIVLFSWLIDVYDRSAQYVHVTVLVTVLVVGAYFIGAAARQE